MSDMAELRMLFGAAFVLIVVWIVYIHRWYKLIEREKPGKRANNTKKPKRRTHGAQTRRPRKK